MSGTETGVFSGWSGATRGQCITILKRLSDKRAGAAEGSAEAAIPGMAFSDVPPDMYYAAPISWAIQNGIANGLEAGLFGPEIGMTREQLATMLYNFARYSDCELTLNEVTDFDVYRDESDISPYAREALLWACDRGIIRGITEADPKDMSAVFLFPLKGTNRGEIAAILERFVGLYPELFN